MGISSSNHYIRLPKPVALLSSLTETIVASVLDTV